MTGHTLLFDRTTEQGRLELSGRDRFDLLHRMSTNDLTKVEPGESRNTVLTTALARIIDLVTLYALAETAIMVTNYPDVVGRWLQQHIFFRDQVKLRNLSASLMQLELHGETAIDAIEKLFPDANNLSGTRFQELPVGELLGNDAAPKISFIAPIKNLLGPANAFRLIGPTAQLEIIKYQLLGAGTIQVGSAETYESLRIAAGIPGAGHELTEEYIPLEVGLWDAVSFQKGCYIGQEIIARMESRNRLAKTLVRLNLSAPAEVGATIYSSGSEGNVTIGTLTSIAPQSDGSAVAIGFIKPDYLSAGLGSHGPALRIAPTSVGADPIIVEVVAVPAGKF